MSDAVTVTVAPRARLVSLVALAGRVAIAAVVACNGQLRFGDVPDDGGAPDASLPSLPTAPDAGSVSRDAATVDVASPPAVDAASADASTRDASPPPAGCASDVDCKLGTLHCDVLSGACFACVADTQCATAGAKRCDAALHRCVECGVDGDCGAGQRCELQTRRCINTCQSITGCPGATPFCDLSHGTCARCHSEVECLLPGDARNCDTANGYCVDCVTDAHCKAAAPRCDRTRGACVQCLSSSDCPAAAPLCDPASFTCVTG